MIDIEKDCDFIDSIPGEVDCKPIEKFGRVLYPMNMRGNRPWEEYTEIAERTLNRCNMNDPHEQTIDYVAVMLWTESKLADLEKDISEISSINPCDYRKLKCSSAEYTELSRKVHSIQKTASKPDSYLHELIGVGQDEIEEKAIAQILTQLGWEYFPRHLNRFLNLYERVGRGLNSKKQQLLTTGIILASFVAILVSLATLITMF